MEIWLWVLVGMMAVIIAALLVKVYILQKAAAEIADGFADRLITDTNTLIDISTRDRSMCRLADVINRQLYKLREQRHRFCEGDLELKHAVANISHDLRTPLTAICGYLDLLEQEEHSPSSQRYIGIIRNRAELLTLLTEELFRYSVITSEGNSADREPVAIGSVLEESIASFYSERHEHGIVPQIQMPQEKVVRMLDKSALARVFSNLLNNAVKYSEGDLQITLLADGEIIFANTVHGLDEVQVGKLFDRFYTVESASKSTGLGLAIARTLAEQMGGTICAEYEQCRLTVRVVFPDISSKCEERRRNENNLCG